ncbi:MAG: hypothetical protein Q8M33_09120, partial [Hydrogenophaga sp.]|nr:hypothetical protein [Hydrogenophaga sp.]
SQLVLECELCDPYEDTMHTIYGVWVLFNTLHVVFGGFLAGELPTLCMWYPKKTWRTRAVVGIAAV